MYRKKATGIIKREISVASPAPATPRNGEMTSEEVIVNVKI